jgi:hypothetical protein
MESDSSVDDRENVTDTPTSSCDAGKLPDNFGMHSTVIYLHLHLRSRSLIQRTPTECRVSECDRGSSTVRTPWSTRVVQT